jgi:hypothetical protein
MRYLVFVLALAGCGDNSQECGPGTIDQDGVCVPAPPCGLGTVDNGSGQCVPDGTTVCGQGTRLDPTTGQCQLDPNACQDGTIPIGEACVDPTTQLVADLEEGPEPNGRGVLGEVSASPAGVVVPHPVGAMPYVIHGQLLPFEDADGDGQLDADVDTYQVTVTVPTLLRITAIGLRGVDGGFVALDQVPATDPMSRWLRYAYDTQASASRRDLYLPVPGTYAIAIADARTLVLPGSSATGEYYVTIDQLSVPVPMSVPVSAGSATVSGTTGGAAVSYELILPTGTATIRLAMPAVQAQASELALVGAVVRAVADEGSTAATASLVTTGPTDTVVVVDDVVDYAPAPVAYTLTVHVVP